jgi:thioredoxin reductase
MKQTVPSRMSAILPHVGWRDRTSQETLAAITLTSKRHTLSIMEQDSNNGEFAFHIDSSVSMLNRIDPSTLVLSGKQRQRFNHAMRFLGLSPKIHILQALDEHDEDGPILTTEQKRTGPTSAEAKGVLDRLDAKVKGD